MMEAKRRFLQEPHGVTSQKMPFFSETKLAYICEAQGSSEYYTHTSNKIRISLQCKYKHLPRKSNCCLFGKLQDKQTTWLFVRKRNIMPEAVTADGRRSFGKFRE
jgi:hypothetical protein